VDPDGEKVYSTDPYYMKLAFGTYSSKADEEIAKKIDKQVESIIVPISGAIATVYDWFGPGKLKHISEYIGNKTNKLVKKLYRTSKKFPRMVMKNKYFGAKSKLFGNRASNKQQIMGKLNDKNSKLRIGWSTYYDKKNKKGYSVFRIGYGNKKHIDILKVSNSIGNEILKKMQKE